MYDRTRLSRLITAALASCAITWALAGAATARPDAPQASTTATATAAPAFQPAVGDTDKVPSASAAPAYQPQIGDALKTPDPRQVQRVLNGIGRGKTPGQPVVHGTNDDTGTIALIVAIVAMLTALAAMTMFALRQTRPALRP